MVKHQHILLFDFETTGLNANFEQIIEVGALLLEKKGDVYVTKEELSLLVQADKPLPAIITNITNITDEMLLRDGVTQQEAFEKLYHLMNQKDTLLVAYNILFDLSFLNAWMKKFVQPKAIITHDVLDVMAIYRDRYPYPHKLDSAVLKYNIEIPNTHRALDDIKATYEVLKCMYNEKQNISKYVNVIGFNPKYPVFSKMAHVKYVAQRGGYLEIEKS